MPREYGQQFPERPLMSTLSDLLGIPHFTTSRGSTVRTDFLWAVAVAVGAEPEGLAKDDLIRLVWETTNRRAMPADRLSPGGTVTNRVLQDVVDGLLKHGVDVAGPAPVDFLFSEVAGIFDPDTLGDERTRKLVEMAQREGQNTFRTTVLNAYGAACALTGTSVPAVLDAAHIAPYRGKAYNVVPNGLCLRKDVHALFDRGMLAVHEGTYEVLLAPVLLGSEYENLSRGTMRMPRSKADRPSVPALRAHRLWAGLDLD